MTSHRWPSCTCPADDGFSGLCGKTQQWVNKRVAFIWSRRNHGEGSVAGTRSLGIVGSRVGEQRMSRYRVGVYCNELELKEGFRGIECCIWMYRWLLRLGCGLDGFGDRG